MDGSNIELYDFNLNAAEWHGLWCSSAGGGGGSQSDVNTHDT